MPSPPISAPASNRKLIRVPHNINDPEFAAGGSDRLRGRHPPGGGRAAWRGGDSPERNRHASYRAQDHPREIRRHDRPRPAIVGGGAGTGLSAKCEEEGGIDLIVIYNSGRYRMAGRGSLAGLMAYGNANDVVVEMAHGSPAGGAETPGAGRRQRHRSLPDPRRLPARLAGLGFSGVQNFPTSADRRPVPQEPRGDRHGLRLEVEMIRARTSAIC
jgi:hypothetical protein